ncbi:MAG: hypothetical protein IJ802_07025 [Kiritimatiellae bacterium]|nr:hypothetical protein [Kiritimatiellia bacterium]
MRKIYIDARDFQHDIWTLAAKVADDAAFAPDVIVSLWRGGAAVGIGIQEFLAAKGRKTTNIPLVCKSYAGIGESTGKAVFTGLECVLDEIAAVGGRLGRRARVLVADDIFDTGATARDVRETLGGVCDMRLAAVYVKSGVAAVAKEPEYHVKRLAEWTVFPHEIEGLAQCEIREKSEMLARLMGVLEEGA